ncbi:MAG: DUF2069 domain-containing protein [Rhodocyclaceae bacterium]|nr:DUF2069 domain-containing protein [Rhodocyclaceae bacterium]MBX3667415.1 DUF2069 domain-containing protein [Rhodocyclaceae bacterium]
MSARLANLTAVLSLIALIMLGTAWELWLAPLRPGGSWLVLKVLPLLGAVFGLLRARRYTHQWMSLASLLYLAEGLVRATSDSGASARLAIAEIVLAVLLFAGCTAYARLTR